MRILFDSKQLTFKDPFGTLIPEQVCTLNIHIPASVQATGVTCIVNNADGSFAFDFPLEYRMKKGAYEIFQGKFSLPRTGLYFYYFTIAKRNGSFRLFKQGDQTNMEAGDLWQVSCVPPISPPPIGLRAPPSTKYSPTGFSSPASATLPASWSLTPSTRIGTKK